MWFQFEQPPYDRTNLPARTPAKIPTVDGRHDTWKRCGANETRTGQQLTMANDYCAVAENNALGDRRLSSESEPKTPRNRTRWQT